MGPTLESGVSRRFSVIGACAIALALAVLLWAASSAKSAELLYWNNYSGDPDSIGTADINGNGGGPLNLTGVTLDGPEGMAIDTAGGRLFVTSYQTDQILAVKLDGSGASVFSTAGAPVEEPMGIVVDPVTKKLFWVNTEAPAGGEGSIAWANLDSSAGGVLNIAGATLDGPYRMGLDPVGGRVFWANTDPETDTISFANTNNTGGGGNLNITGATPPSGITGFATDPASGRIYWIDNSVSEGISFANLAGGGGGDQNLTGATVDDPYGLALDPSLGRIYWGNYGNGEERLGAIGFANLAGGGGGINIASAPVDGPQDPLVLKNPSGTGAPTIARSAKVRSELTCSQGSWAADFAGGFVYQAPTTYAYQWSKDGAAIPGATTPALAATTPGAYACAVTASNHAGSANQTSAPINVKAAKVKLTTKKKAKVKPGGVATFKVKGVNQGDLKSKNAKVCVKVPKKAAKDLKAKPKCKALGKVKGGGKDSAKLKIKVGESASGTYKVTFQVKGSPGKAAKAKIVVG
jgi:DNA-binding beta-propeller fold protein YncE